MKKQITQLLTLAIVISSIACATPYKNLENGDYQTAIDRAIRKVQGKKNKKTKYIQTIEEAFEKIVSQEMRQAESLRTQNRAASWEEIHHIYKRIQYLQGRVEPLLPLYSKTGYEAQFKFVKIDPLVIESKSKAVDFLYYRSQDLVDNAEDGDMYSAREAYGLLEKLDRLEINYKNSRELKNRALTLGQVHVFLKIINNSNAILPSDLEREILTVSLEELRKERWIKYHTAAPNRQAEYLVAFNISNIDISPESIREKVFFQQKEIEDGWEYVLDENGNVAKDTLGNDIKEAKYSIVKANVIETQQFKSSRVSGRIDFINNNTGTLLKSEKINAENVFENYFSIFQGDKRALDSEGKRYMDNGFISFPSDEQMVYDGFEALKPEMIRYLRNHRNVFKI